MQVSMEETYFSGKGPRVLLVTLSCMPIYSFLKRDTVRTLEETQIQRNKQKEGSMNTKFNNFRSLDQPVNKTNLLYDLAPCFRL